MGWLKDPDLLRGQRCVVVFWHCWRNNIVRSWGTNEMKMFMRSRCMCASAASSTLWQKQCVSSELIRQRWTRRLSQQRDESWDLAAKSTGHSAALGNNKSSGGKLVWSARRRKVSDYCCDQLIISIIAEAAHTFHKITVSSVKCWRMTSSPGSDVLTSDCCSGIKKFFFTVRRTKKAANRDVCRAGTRKCFLLSHLLQTMNRAMSQTSGGGCTIDSPPC